MYGDSANRIVDLGNLVKEFDGKDNNDAEYRTHDGSAKGRNRVASGGNAHKAGQSRVIGHGHIGFPVANPGEHKGHAAGNRRSQIGIEENHTGADQRVIGIHGYRGAAVEAEPAEPKDEHAQRSCRNIMSQNGFRLAFLVVLTDTGAEHGRADAGADAADHMYCRGTGKIMESQLTQPAAAPDPVPGDGVDKQGNTGRVNAVSAEFGALCHGAGNDGGRGRAEYGLENGKRPQRNAGRGNKAVILGDAGIQPAHDRASRAEHNAEAEQPEAWRANAEVHQILHQDVAGVLRPREAGLAQGKARLHEEDHCSAQQYPNGVYGTQCHSGYLLILSIQLTFHLLFPAARPEGVVSPLLCRRDRHGQP